MSKPTIGVFIATPGRRSIYATLMNILSQGLIAGDDILVIGDGLHKPTKALVEAFGPPFRYIATQPTRDWGHSQDNFGIKKVKGDVIIAQDDDDLFAPRAFDEIRATIERHPGVPLLGRVKTPNLGILWTEVSDKTALDGHGLVLPNVKEKLGYFASAYDGDQTYIKSSLEPYDDLYWIDRVWAITRSNWLLTPFRNCATINAQYEKTYKDEWLKTFPQLEGRPDHGPDDWTWFFHEPKEIVPSLAVRMFIEDDRLWATASCLGGSEKYLWEIAEWCAWAGQGMDVWFKPRNGTDDYELVEALESKGYKRHGDEWIHDWEPKWWIKENKVNERTDLLQTPN